MTFPISVVIHIYYKILKYVFDKTPTLRNWLTSFLYICILPLSFWVHFYIHFSTEKHRRWTLYKAQIHFKHNGPTYCSETIRNIFPPFKIFKTLYPWQKKKI